MLIKFIISIVGLMIILCTAEMLYGNIATPKAIPPFAILDRDELTVYSFVPRSSLFRSANSWYDRVAETYEKGEDGKFKLTKRRTTIYVYPFFLGGLRHITREKVFQAN